MEVGNMGKTFDLEEFKGHAKTGSGKSRVYIAYTEGEPMYATVKRLRAELAKGSVEKITEKLFQENGLL